MLKIQTICQIFLQTAVVGIKLLRKKCILIGRPIKTNNKLATSTLWTLTSWFVEKWNILNYCYGFYNIADLFYQKSHQIQFNLPQSNIQTKMKKEKHNTKLL